ncbi:MAG TPA: diguanylate cyclase, partial [Chthonomonadaceae bacterium]|nr:diguanylate cyclase [Chthonomonadaceae bacterium]
MLTQEIQERLLAILDATPDLVAINDMHGRLCYLNPAGRQMLGIGEQEQIISPAGKASGEEQDSEAAQLLDDLFPIGLKEGAWQAERALRARDGRRIPVSQVVLAHKDAGGQVVYLSTIARDMTERKALDAQAQEQMWLVQETSRQLEAQKAQLEEANRRLEEANLRLAALAVTDGLTGLKNHRAFQDRLAEEFARCRRYSHPLSILLLDVDHFKQYNDTFGHPAGDKILKRLADALQSSARATDFVARY